jgi:hypothetical protein
MSDIGYIKTFENFIINDNILRIFVDDLTYSTYYYDLVKNK